MIPGSGGCRKLQWQAPGRGKRGGSRVIYFNEREDGLIVLLTVYAKSNNVDVPRRTLRKLTHRQPYSPKYIHE